MGDKKFLKILFAEWTSDILFYALVAGLKDIRYRSFFLADSPKFLTNENNKKPKKPGHQETGIKVFRKVVNTTSVFIFT